MRDTYNIYCDESCHLEHDGIPTMVIGAVWCPGGHGKPSAPGGVADEPAKVIWR